MRITRYSGSPLGEGAGRDPVDLADLLRSMGSPERLKSDGLARCHRCGCVGTLKQRFAILEPPLVLAVQILRFGHDASGLQKNSQLALAPRLGLTLGASLAPSATHSPGYGLAAQILRQGSLAEGHFAARGLARGLWWACNGEHVIPCSRDDVEAPSAHIYGLVYTRR